MRIETPHRELVIQSSARVEVHRGAAGAVSRRPGERRRMRRLRLAGRRFARFRALRQPARGDFRGRDHTRAKVLLGPPVYEAAIDLNAVSKRILPMMRKQPASRLPRRGFRQARGVCQDFAIS